MKKLTFALMMALLVMAVACMAAETKVEAPSDCKHCGMDRTKFSHSRMLITYKDGSSGTCSINCAALELKANKGREVKKIEVGDFDSKKLIDAKAATWVIGGSVKGVMTPVAKWAFAEKKNAEKFVKKNGGKLATFADILHAAEGELEEKSSKGGHGGHKM